MSSEPQDAPIADEQAQPSAADSMTDEQTADASEPLTADDAAAITAALEADIADLKEQVLRAQADAQNARRRAEQDVEKARKFALEKFVNELLPVADNLERAIAAGADSEQAAPVLEGVELTLKSLQETLKKFHVAPVDPEGEPFDPQLHQAMSMVPNADVEPNTVLNVFQKGYTLNGRLVRPAMVVVASAPA
ncbi:MAG: nucleotide exchange factor GrpE [Cellvibrionaceae bacterium]|nr:nucleotide exchange factor GrpE [Cellvibrionaceae bacterium]